jgi:Na+-transporting NADH:ubiquinone oxidoreductase subunit NqrE
MQESVRVQSIELGRLRAVALAMVASIPFAMAYQRIVDPSLVVTLTSGGAWLAAVAVFAQVRRDRIPARWAAALMCGLWCAATASIV